jgi:hypothetical protein
MHYIIVLGGKKDMKFLKKYFTIGIVALFVGASVVPIVLGINYNDLDHISKKCTQTNSCNNVVNWVEWAGDASVIWQWNGDVDKNASCPPNREYTLNLSEPTTLCIIVLLNTTLDLRRNFLISRGIGYEFEVQITGERYYKTSSLHKKDFGLYRDTIAFVFPIEINGNETLDIHIEVLVTPMLWLIPLIPGDFDTRNVIINVQLP